jgi:hypothetical protein
MRHCLEQKNIAVPSAVGRPDVSSRIQL